MKNRLGNSDIIDIVCTIIHQTDGAWLIDAARMMMCGFLNRLANTTPHPEPWPYPKAGRNGKD
jgi:hypothetical protein